MGALCIFGNDRAYDRMKSCINALRTTEMRLGMVQFERKKEGR